MDYSVFVVKYFRTFGMLSLRYLVFAGFLYLVFYVWKRRDFVKYKIQQKFPDNPHILREIKYSFLSLSVFSFVSLVLFTFRRMGYTKVYTDFNDHSVAYFIFSVVAFILIHDTYFYFAHRFMHWRKIYPYVHRIHHMSTNPTPWAAFAFHPLEALTEVAIVPILVFLMPLHPYAILLWVLYQTGMNVLGHLGFELFKSGFTTGTISKWHNTSTHHNMHHKLVNCNYGLYFNFWDRVLGTNHKDYEREFEQVKHRAKQAEKELETIGQTTELANG
ncbi:MAG: sterol desaturase family protein [Bacteroidetes bacterium]|nr:sterol desaturase family protein [Bacteroidota bacterium]